ncbi:hypothetical protein D3C78_1841200 [compost metagenome]
MAQTVVFGTDRGHISGSAAAHRGCTPPDGSDSFHTPDSPIPPLHRCDTRRDDSDPGKLRATQAGFYR